MASDRLDTIGFSNHDIIAVSTSKDLCGKQAASGIDESTEIISSLSLKHPFPFNRLPPELLTAVFLEYAQQYQESYVDKNYLMTQVPHWVSVSYVCRYWRNVALDCANLWSHLFFISPKWVDELLRRSKAAPLIVHTDLCKVLEPHSGPIGSLEKVLKNMERIQDIWIQYSSNDVMEIICPRLNVPAPLLQSLHLTSSSDISRYPFGISKDIFSGVIPRLKKVELTRCLVDWSSPIFNELTELSLEHIVNNRMEPFLLVLRRLPGLRQLHLCHALPTVDLGISPINHKNIAKPVTLRQLEQLTLWDSQSIPEVVAFLAQLEIPITALVKLQCELDDPGEISQILPFTTDRRNSHPSLPQPTASDQTVLRYLNFTGFGDVVYGTSNLANAYGSKIFSFKQQNMSSHVSFHRFLKLPWYEIVRACSVVHLNAIIVHGAIEHEIDDSHPWEIVFQNTPDLRVIGVERGSIKSLICELQPRNSGVIPAPTLRDIGFKEIDFDQGKCTDNGRHEYAQGGCLQCLHNVLASRAEAGIMIQRILFNDCSTITKDDLIELSKVVGKVEQIENSLE